MQVSKILVTLAIAAGFASASFAQGSTSPASQAAPAAKAAIPAPAAAEKKVEAPKAAEAAKIEASKSEPIRADAVKPAGNNDKSKGHEHKGGMHEKHEKSEGKSEMKPEAKPAATPAPTTK